MKADARETENRILDAARAVFLRKGTAGARVQEIAQEAGVNKALVHYYFRSKERLAEAVFRRELREVVPWLIEVLVSDATIDEKVPRVMEAMIEGLLRNPLLPGYVFGEVSHHPQRAKEFVEAAYGTVESIAGAAWGKLGGQIEVEVRQGRMRPISAYDFTVNLFSLCVYPFLNRPATMLAMSLDERGFEELMRRRAAELPGFFLAGLRP